MIKSIIKYSVDESAAEPIHKLSWISQPIPKQVYEKAINFCSKVGFQPIECPNIEGLSKKQFRSIRSAYLRDKIIRGHHKMLREIPKMTALYKAGADILDITGLCTEKSSHKRPCEYSPCIVMKNILLYMRVVSNMRINEICSGKTNGEKYLDKRDFQQLQKAMKYDIVDRDQRISQQIAQEHEDQFVAVFVDLGIECKTQNILIEEQIAEYGRAVNTPDLLFVDPVEINGEKIAWIEYKDYVGAPFKLIIDAAQNQCRRYYEQWGKGAICYAGSFVDGFEVPNTIVLDGSGIF